jgi:hypothetical protein
MSNAGDEGRSSSIVFRRPGRLALRSLIGDRRGGVAVTTGLLVPVLLGFTGLGTEVGIWMYARQSLQGAADSAALSAAVTITAGNANKATGEARLAAAQYGYIDGTGGFSLTINNPPTSGNFAANNKAIEVIVAQPQPRLFTAMFLTGDVTVRARAVSLAGMQGNACVLALDPSAKGALTATGTSSVNLNGCSIAVNSVDPSAALLTQGSAIITTDSANIVGGVTDSGSSKIVATNGITTGAAPTADPYNGTTVPTVGSCDHTNFSAGGTVTLTPGVFCGGFKLTSGANVTLSPGTYIINGGAFAISGGSTLSGSGVTLVFTGSAATGYASANVNGGATVSLSAPTTGNFAGLAIFADPAAPSSTSFTFNGGSSQNISGAIYAPSAAVTYTGGSTTGANCTQLVARAVTFAGNAVLNQNCAGTGTRNIGTIRSALVE